MTAPINFRAVGQIAELLAHPNTANVLADDRFNRSNWLQRGREITNFPPNSTPSPIINWTKTRAEVVCRRNKIREFLWATKQLGDSAFERKLRGLIFEARNHVNKTTRLLRESDLLAIEDELKKAETIFDKMAPSARFADISLRRSGMSPLSPVREEESLKIVGVIFKGALLAYSKGQRLLDPADPYLF